jgi:hypothetical protein
MSTDTIDLPPTTATPPPSPSGQPSGKPAPTPDQVAAEKKTQEGVIEFGRAVASKLIKDREVAQKRVDDASKAIDESRKPPVDPNAQPDPAAAPPAPKRRKKKETDDSIPPLTAREAADIAASAAAAAVRESRKPDPTPTPAAPPEPVKLVLPEEDEEDRHAYEFLVRAKPDKYGNLAQRVADFAKKEESYRTKWEEENPGQEFDPTAEDHNQFYDENQPRVPREDLKWAERESIKAEVKQEIDKSVDPQLQEIRQREALKDAEPKVTKELNKLFGTVLGAADPEYEKAVGNNEELERISKADPVAAKVVAEVTTRYTPVAATIVNLNNGMRFDATDPAHRAVQLLHHETESAIVALDAKDKTDGEGRTFVPRIQYRDMKPAEQAKHWTLGESELLTVLHLQAKGEAEASYKGKKQEFEEWAKASGVDLTKRPEPQRKRQEDPPAPQRGGGPSIGGTPTVGADNGRGNGGGKSGAVRFLDSLGLK